MASQNGSAPKIKLLSYRKAKQGDSKWHDSGRSRELINDPITAVYSWSNNLVMTILITSNERHVRYILCVTSSRINGLESVYGLRSVEADSIGPNHWQILVLIRNKFYLLAMTWWDNAQLKRGFEPSPYYSVSILDLQEFHLTKCCTPSGTYELRPLLTHINHKKSLHNMSTLQAIVSIFLLYYPNLGIFYQLRGIL